MYSVHGYEKEGLLNFILSSIPRIQLWDLLKYGMALNVKNVTALHNF